MLSLITVALLAAAAPAPEAKPADPKPAAKVEEPKAAPTPTATSSAARGANTKPTSAAHEDGHAHHDGDGHDHGEKKEEPLDAAAQQVVKLGEAMHALSNENLAAYTDMLKTIQESKDCAASAKDVSGRFKKLESDLAQKRAAMEALKKSMKPENVQSAAGIALARLTDDLKKLRDRTQEHKDVVGAFKGKCPQQGAQVEKAIMQVRKRLVP
ncbi:MAG: hypothetical protein HY901_27045 [Deltaproteobacteria bacterium]|nr:hypothetical protein [Deltaproteobacteria bacterium]